MDSRRRDRRHIAALLLSGVPQAGYAIGPLARVRPDLALPYGLLGAVAVVAAVLLRRRPGPAVVVAGALEVTAVVLWPLPPLALFPVAVAVVLAASAGARWWAVGTVAAMVLVPLTQLFLPDADYRPGQSLGTMFLLVAALGGGLFRRARRQRMAEEEARLADRQRIAVEQERVRIARELHDVLAHSLSSIQVQAGVGLHLAADRPAAATEALTTIRDASRSALDEVRALLGVLRGDERAPRTPEPDLDALPALVTELQRSGARIRLRDELRPRPSQAVQLALYRIAQESMTNARRHAPGSEVTVSLTREADDVVLRVRDAQPGAHPAAPVPGNGITGMRERVARLAGTLDLLPQDGGLEVVARIPSAASMVVR